MNDFLSTPFIIVYTYSVVLTMYVAYQETRKPNWWLIVPGATLWPLSIAAFIVLMAYMAVIHLPPRWYKQWKRRRSLEYKALQQRLDIEEQTLKMERENRDMTFRGDHPPSSS